MISWKVGGGAFVMLESLKFEWFAEGDRESTILRGLEDKRDI